MCSHEVGFSAWPWPDLRCLALNEWTNLAGLHLPRPPVAAEPWTQVRDVAETHPPRPWGSAREVVPRGAARLRNPAPAGGVNRRAGLPGADGRGEPAPVRTRLRVAPVTGSSFGDTRLEIHTV